MLNSSDYEDFNFYIDEKLTNHYKKFDFFKNDIKKRKVLSKILITLNNKNKKKNSIKRDSNSTLMQQFLCLCQKNGNKLKLNKNINLFLENLNLFLLDNDAYNDFNKNNNYSNYNDFKYLINSNFYYSDINYVLYIYLTSTKTIFEIKTKKNPKKLKLDSKYKHELIYIPKQKRLKYSLRSINFYTENFKNYKYWERLFWSFSSIILNKNNSILHKRRDYLNFKSIKFFKKVKYK